jgi:amino acid transporter
MILDYFLIPLLSVVYAGLTAARLVPRVPYSFWAVLFTFSITIINVRGIRVTAQASRVMMAIMTFSAALFVALAALRVVQTHGWNGLWVGTAILNRNRRRGRRQPALRAWLQ